MNNVLVGKVSTRDGARFHFDVIGRAYCGAGSGITSAATRDRFDGVAVLPEMICRRCLKGLTRALVEAAAAGDSYAESALFWMQPEPTPAEEAAQLAELRAHIREANRPEPTPLERSGLSAYDYQSRLLAQLDAVDEPAGLFALGVAA